MLLQEFNNYSPVGYENKKGKLFRPMFNPIDKVEIILKENILDIFGNFVSSLLFIIFTLLLVLNYNSISSTNNFAKFITVTILCIMGISAVPVTIENFKKLNSDNDIKAVKLSAQGIQNGKIIYPWSKIDDAAILSYNGNSNFILIKYMNNIISIDFSNLSEVKDLKEFKDLLPKFNSKNEDYENLRNLIGKHLIK